MTKLYVTLHLLLADLGERGRRDERGQGTLEYIGMVAVAALLVSFVVAAVSEVDIKKFLVDTIKKVTG